MILLNMKFIKISQNIKRKWTFFNFYKNKIKKTFLISIFLDIHRKLTGKVELKSKIMRKKNEQTF